MKKNIGVIILVIAMWLVGIKASFYVLMNPTQDYNGLPLWVVYLLLVVYLAFMIYGTFVIIRRIKRTNSIKK